MPDAPKPKEARIEINISLERNEITEIAMNVPIDPLVIATIGGQIVLRAMQEYKEQSKGKPNIELAKPKIIK